MQHLPRSDAGGKAAGGAVGSKASKSWEGTRVKPGSVKKRSVRPTASLGANKAKASKAAAKISAGADGGVPRAKGKREAVQQKKAKQLAAKVKAARQGGSALPQRSPSGKRPGETRSNRT
jgi:hypothetical protein